MPHLAPVLALLTAFALGAAFWTLAEYVLHRFAMHHLKGRGIMSREHLEHHVSSTWNFDATMALAWVGVVLVAVLGWLPLGWIAVHAVVGVGLALGWIVGYFHYEYQHAMAHRRPPTTSYGRRLRRHHFHHHFGHPMANHGVTTAIWDRVFGTLEVPDKVRVPRRLVLPWLVDADGELLPQFNDDYVLVGSADPTERTAALDRARAFASVAPVD